MHEDKEEEELQAIAEYIALSLQGRHADALFAQAVRQTRELIATLQEKGEHEIADQIADQMEAVIKKTEK